jgi:hypothetical protein
MAFSLNVFASLQQEVAAKWRRRNEAKLAVIRI